ncbi:MAG: isoleucine--tRNA ligase [Candidatus Komeilibacteria bacterium]|nr:isoleucine--tRNA ligase [Candidatus Komeilibacteria bacterium]
MLNIPKKEEEILAFWKKENIFQKSLDKESPEGDYVFYDGPPFATGLPHYGHILSSVIKDVVPRYWTMKGYHVRRRWGWDCHGLPIENLVEQKLKISGKKQIETLSVDTFNETCRSEVLTYTAQWKEMVDRIGRWIEFDNSYKTMDTTYMESIWWALKNFWDKGLVYEGRKVLLYCPRCETPVSKFEVAMDNSYHDVTEITVTVKFKLHPGQKIGGWTSDASSYLLAWTTTPWTLPGNVALAVGEHITYVVVKNKKREPADKDEFYILAKDRLEPVLGDAYEILHEVEGKALRGLRYEPLYEIPAVKATGKRSHYVATADFVTTEDGTGVVHTAVIYGEDDYNLGVKLDLPMVPLLNTQGKFNDKAPKLVQEMSFKEGDEIVILDLQQRGLLLKQEAFTHAYPHCWRCEAPLFYNAITAWFVNIQKVKDKLIKLNEKVNWYPEHLKHGRFLNNLETAPDWNISRNRYWATALPFWKCDDEKCGETVCVGSIAELKKLATNFSEVYARESPNDIDLHKHVIDKVILKCPKCGGVMHRIPEVIDCWVESGSMPFAEYHYPFENEAEFKRRQKGEGKYIAEYIAQTRAWFYYMHVVSAILFDDIAFKNVVTTGTIMNEKGDKMSKSRMNYPDPWKIINEYGSDALRFYLMNSVVMQGENLNFSEKDVKEVYNKVINTLYNVVSFYELYAGSSGADEKESNHILDKWIITRLHQLVKMITHDMDTYDTVQATRRLIVFVQDLSTWYVRRSRDRFKDTVQRGDAVSTLKYVLATAAKLAAPFIPFAAEHIWKSVGMEETSVHLTSWPKRSTVDEKLILKMAEAQATVTKAHALRASVGVKVRQPLSILEITIRNLPKEILDIIADEVNVKKIVVVEKISIGDGIVTDEAKTVAFHTVLTDELKAEGALRELVRMTNSLRKEKGLKPQDIVAASFHTASEFLKTQVIEKYAEQLSKQTSTARWTYSEALSDDAMEIVVNNETLRIQL